MEFVNLQIDGKEFASSTIINYSSLIQLLSIIVKKCNNLETKFNAMDIDINEKEKRLSNIEISLNINNEQPNYLVTSIRKKSIETNNDNMEQIREKVKEIYMSPERKKEKIELNYTMFSELYKKVKDNDKSIKNLINTVNNNKINEEEKNAAIKNNTEIINSVLKEETKKLNSFMKKVNDKLINYDKDIEILKDKLKDFNIYDIFKFQNTGSEVDENLIKNLITNLEIKINKKFILYDEKLKLMNTDIFRIKEEEKNDNAMISGYNMTFEKMRIIRDELIQKYNEMSNSFNNNVEEINKKINYFDSKIKLIEDISNINEEKYKEFKKKEEKINELISSNLDRKSFDRMNFSFLGDEKNGIIKKYKDQLNNLEKYCKTNFEEINIKELEKRLISLEKNNKNYLLYEDDLNNINEKNRNQDIKIKEHHGKLESIFQDIELIKDEIKDLIKKADIMGYDISKISIGEVKNIIESKTNSINIDTSKFIPSSIFNETKKENIIKFDKIQKEINELEINLEKILKKLEHTPSDTDFSQFQEIIKNMIENIVIKNKKQFANKMETVKSYKLLETKLNTINDSYNKKINGADNWLLAKKPLNSFQCASCESIIKGDLEQKGEYIAWNKYPFREENKSYRMGHGFSHMLHMINEGLMKDTGEYIKDEENIKNKKDENNIIIDKNKKNNVDDNSLEILPKVKKKNNIYDLSIGFDSPLHNPRDIRQINKTIDNQENNTPHILKILKKNRSSVFNTASNNEQIEKPKKIENIKYINFNINNKEEE